MARSSSMNPPIAAALLPLAHPFPTPQFLHDLRNPPSKEIAKVNLIRLTVRLNHPLSPPNKCPASNRKWTTPKYPIDEKDPEWLSKWLRTLRLHKYTKNLQGLKPSELLELDEREIFRRGVDMQGARTKLLVVCTSAMFMTLW